MSDLNHEKSVLKMLERQPYPGIKNKISDFYKDVLGAQDISKVLKGEWFSVTQNTFLSHLGIMRPGCGELDSRLKKT